MRLSLLGPVLNDPRRSDSHERIHGPHALVSSDDFTWLRRVIRSILLAITWMHSVQAPLVRARNAVRSAFRLLGRLGPLCPHFDRSFDWGYYQWPWDRLSFEY